MTYFSAAPALALKKLFWVILAFSVLTLIALGVIDAGLKNPTTPGGIISFELCAYTSSCDSALITWGAKGQQLALLSLGLDYLFLMLYPTLVCVGLLLVAPQVPSTLKKITVLAAWVALTAGVADAGENFSLIQIILNQSSEHYGRLASTFATIKFTVLSVTLSWLLFTCVAHVLIKRKST